MEGCCRLRRIIKISNSGKLFSLYSNRILKPSEHKDGYLIQGLHKNGEIKYHLIHRLVATAFLPNPDHFPDVNHKDLNKKNNSVENLEWCSRKQNLDHAKRNGKSVGFKPGERHGCKLTEDDVREIRRRLNEGISCAQLAKEYKVSDTTIYLIRDYEMWKEITI